MIAHILLSEISFYIAQRSSAITHYGPETTGENTDSRGRWGEVRESTEGVTEGRGGHLHQHHDHTILYQPYSKPLHLLSTAALCQTNGSFTSNSLGFWRAFNPVQDAVIRAEQVSVMSEIISTFL